MTTHLIDLDANATTALDPRVLEAMKPYLLAGGNPESRHSLGRIARKAWDDSREKTASILGADPDELTFTSGGTEANNAAIKGLLNRRLKGHPNPLPTVVLSAIEHPAVAEPVAYLQKKGVIETLHAPVQAHGQASPSTWNAFLTRENTPVLAACMLANNETGAIQPVAELAAMAAEHGIAFHTDAVQAVGRISVNFHQLGVTTLAAGSHKMHGPPGIGILLVRNGAKIEPLMYGGGQQRGVRPGTPVVGLAVGLARALELWDLEKTARELRWLSFKSQFLDELQSQLSQTSIKIELNSLEDPSECLPQTLNLWLNHPQIVGEVALIQLDLEGLAISLGSACASGSNRPSPVLKAMGFADDRARSSIRVSFSALTTAQEVSESSGILARTAFRLIQSEDGNDTDIVIERARRRFHH
jgi:cysteine desulfurase